MLFSILKQIAVGRKGGIVQLYETNTFCQVREWKNASRKFDDPIISLEYCSNLLYSCSADGIVTIFNILDGRVCTSVIKEPISAFRVHPIFEDVMASGGKDRDLEIYQMSPFFDEFPAQSITQKKIFRAKHTKQDDLGNKNAIWISDIQFLDLNRPFSEGLRVATATRYGEILLYETRVSQRPIVQVLASYHPIIQLWFGGNEHELIFTDTQFNIGKFDSVTGKSSSRISGQPSSRILSMSAAYFHNDYKRLCCDKNTQRENRDENFEKVDENGITERGSTSPILNEDFVEEVRGRENKTIADYIKAFPIHGDRVGSLRQTTPGYEERMEALSIMNPVSYQLLTQGFLNQDLQNNESQSYTENTDESEPRTNIHSSRNTHTQEFNSLITPDQNSPPQIILASGGLDSYLRIFDWSTSKLVSKINIGSRISKVIIVDSQLVEEEDISMEENTIESKAMLSKDNPEIRIKRKNDDVHDQGKQNQSSDSFENNDVHRTEGDEATKGSKRQKTEN